MYLNITDAAKQKLDVYLAEDVQVLLDLNDGVGCYSATGCGCTPDFRILLLDKIQDMKDYQTQIESTIGDIFIKDHSKIYMDETMTLDFNSSLYAFQLKGPSGTLDMNVPIIDLRPEKTE